MEGGRANGKAGVGHRGLEAEFVAVHILGPEGWYLRRARCEALLVAAALIALRVGEIGHHVGRPMIGDVEVRCDLVGRKVRRRSGDERDRCPAEVAEDAVYRIEKAWGGD